MGKLILCNNTDYQYDNITYVEKVTTNEDYFSRRAYHGGSYQMAVTRRRKIYGFVCDTKKKQLKLFVFHKLLYLCGVIQNAGDVRLINYHIYG